MNISGKTKEQIGEACRSELLSPRNQYGLKSCCRSDLASIATMADHNIGAGGVSVFSSTDQNLMSRKRWTQRNKRLIKKCGISVAY